MKAVEINEMRSIDGGYSVRCLGCNAVRSSMLKISITQFYFAHRKCGANAVIWNGSNGDKWWG